MKKKFLHACLILSVAALLPMQSCIGSFPLTNKVLSWNHQVGNKFINELVFFAFWVLPVYEVTALSDLLVINSIEFWSGSNPLEASVKIIETEHGDYLIASDESGYSITAPNGDIMRLDFNDESNTWSVAVGEEEALPFMTIVDENNVKMLCPDGEFHEFALTQDGVDAYASQVSGLLMASN